MHGTVLIADDSDVGRALLAAILQGAGLSVHEARDGEEALALARQHAFDLALLDVMMPGLDGYDVLARFQSDPKLDALPVIFLTSRGATQDKVRGLELGAADYVTKPYEAEEVLARVHTQLRLRQLTRSLASANDELRARQALIEADLRAAADIQRALLPRPPLRQPGLSAASAFLPSQHVGGDLFNLLRVDRDHVAAWVLDVSGHGVGAAMVTVSVAQRLLPQSGIVSGDVRAVRPEAAAPGVVLAALDKEYPLERFDRFFTLAYAVIEIATGKVRYSLAGHPPPLVLRRSGELVALEEGGPLMGLSAEHFPEGEVRLERGDRLVLYTDGLYEYRGRASEEFGLERLREHVRNSHALPLQQAAAAIWSAAVEHGGGAEPEDDVTLLVVEWQGPEPARIELRFEATLKEVRKASAQLVQHWSAEGLAQVDRDALELCFAEAANNAVLHAYGGTGRGTIEVTCAIDEDEVELEVRDQGKSIPEGSLGEGEAPEVDDVQLLAESGRGGLLLRSLLDEVEAVATPQGNRVRMVRARTPN